MTFAAPFAKCACAVALASTVGAASLRAQAQPVPEATPPSNQSPGVFPEPRPLAKAMKYVEKRLGDRSGGDAKNGFYPELSGMVSGAGWISAGPGYRHWLFNDQVLFDTSAAISWRLYKMAQVKLEMPKMADGRVVVGTQVRWQDLTQVNNFGTGPDSRESDCNEYRLTSTEVVGYTTVQPRSWLTVDGRVGRLGSPDIRRSTGPFLRGNQQTRERFPNDPVFGLDQQPSFVHSEISMTADTRDAPGHPERGGLYRAAFSTFVDQDRDIFTFRRTELEAAQYMPVMPHVVIALHGWLVASDPADGHTVPFYLQPSLGGANTLRGYSSYRFHDRNLLLLNAEGRVGIFTHLDAAVFVDAGNVGRRLGDLNLNQTSYGLGLRLHSRGSTMARLDFARSREGWQIVFRTSDPFRASRLSRRTAPVPFAP